MMSGLQFIRSQSTWLSGLWAIVLSQAATEAKTFSEFKDAFKLIRSALPEKATDNAGKDFRKVTAGMRRPTVNILKI